MASAEQIAAIRLLVGPGALSDQEIGLLIDQAVPEGETDPDMLVAQALVWEGMAGRYHALVDTSESGSSRSMSQMFKNASAMATALRGQIAARAQVEVTVTSGRSTTRRITRI
jgi:hypothetical protein